MHDDHEPDRVAPASGQQTPHGGQVEERILAAVARRGAGKTICPSEVAREMAGEEDFAPLMPAVRAAAAALARQGRIEVTQRGRRVDAGTARGPIRLGPPP